MKSIFILLSSIFVFFILIFFSFRIFSITSVEFGLEKISCTNTKILQKETNLTGQNLVLVDEKNIKEMLKKKFFCIENVNFKKSFPNKIQVNIFGRQPAAVITATGSAVLVDSEGVILGEGNLPNLPKIYSQDNESIDIKNTLKIMSKIISFGLEIKEIKIYPKKNLLIEGVYKIYFNLEKNIDLQLASLQLILNQAKIEEKELEYIDLRFDKPVFL